MNSGSSPRHSSPDRKLSGSASEQFLDLCETPAVASSVLNTISAQAFDSMGPRQDASTKRAFDPDEHDYPRPFKSTADTKWKKLKLTREILHLNSWKVPSIRAPK